MLCSVGLYVKVRTNNDLLVDTSRGEIMQIHFDITFPKLPCSWFSVDAMDVSGEVHLDVAHEVYKQRIDAHGRVLEEHDPKRHDVGPTAKVSNKDEKTGSSDCGSCYGAEDPEHRPCCKTCGEVQDAYRAKGWVLGNLESVEQCKGEGHLEEVKAERGEGCHVWGDMSINKVAGNIHFAPGRSFQQGAMHIHDLAPFQGENPFDFSHEIRKMAFGREYPVSERIRGKEGK